MTSFTESVDHLRQTMDEVVENVNDVSTAVEQGAGGRDQRGRKYITVGRRDGYHHEGDRRK